MWLTMRVLMLMLPMMVLMVLLPMRVLMVLLPMMILRQMRVFWWSRKARRVESHPLTWVGFQVTQKPLVKILQARKWLALEMLGTAHVLETRWGLQAVSVG